MKGKQTLKSVLVICALAAVCKKDMFEHARYQRLAVRMPRQKTTVVIAPSILRAIRYTLTTGEVFQNLGADCRNSCSKGGQDRKASQAVGAPWVDGEANGRNILSTAGCGAQRVRPQLILWLNKKSSPGGTALRRY